MGYCDPINVFVCNDKKTGVGNTDIPALVELVSNNCGTVGVRCVRRSKTLRVEITPQVCGIVMLAALLLESHWALVSVWSFQE